MKKFLTIVMCVMALAFAGCKGGARSITEESLKNLDNTVNKCWNITYKYAGITTNCGYEWCTEYQIGLIVFESQKIIGNLGEYSYKEVSVKNEDACLDLDWTD